jgi:N-acyl-D-amino-acid deacylase
MTILIKNVQLLDGTGRPAVKADVLAKNDKISAIGSFPKYRADETIDGMGAYLAPGFIDINTDSDHYLTLFSNPSQKDFVLQGVTTIIGGHCGASLAPLLYGSLESIRQWADINQINVNWQTVGEFLKALSKRPLGVNFGTLVGHTTIRQALVGETDRELTRNELKVFASVLEKAMEQGAFGFSTGLGYAQTHHTTYNEVKELVGAIKKFRGIYATHLRHRKEGLLAAVNEAINIAKDNSVFALINHFQPLAGFEKDYEDGLELISENANTADVYFDVYPFDESVVTVDVFLPRWAQSGDRELMLKNIRTPEIRKKIIAELPKIKGEEIVIVHAPDREFLSGKTLKEFSFNRNLTLIEGLLNLMEETAFRTVVSYKNISAKKITEFLPHKRSIIASNSASFGEVVRFKPERSYKTFTKFLGLAEKEKIMPLELAIKKITSLPAAKLGLENRGLVSDGYAADLVLFKDAEIREVILNGKRAVKDGQFQNVLAGRILRHSYSG